MAGRRQRPDRELLPSSLHDLIPDPRGGYDDEDDSDDYDYDDQDDYGTATSSVRTNALPSDPVRTDSADRKRQHTGSDPQHRSHPNSSRPYPASDHRESDPNMSTPVGSLGNEEDHVDCWTSPTGPTLPSSRLQGENDIVLPRWQPDHEATECPVCHNDFGIFYRRHHCRKCGRVVCSACSPHRITIPRQYIVQPPNPFFEDEANPANPAGAFGGENPALGGGEVVRVCNPCVPDPWTPEATSSTSPPTSANATPPRGDASVTYTDRSVIASHLERNEEANRYRPERYVVGRRERRDRPQAYQSPSPSTPSSRDPRLSPSSQSNLLPTNLPSLFLSRQPATAAQRRRYYGGPGNPASPVPPGPPPRSPTPWPRHLDQSLQPQSPQPQSPQQQGPRREVREEDTCPVCHMELPPGDTIREAHIAACITAHLSATTGRTVPSSRSHTIDAVAPAPAPRVEAPTVAESSRPRPRAASHRPRGMAIYSATEKDCTTADGDAQECVICMVELEEGDQMGRMECLCSFHYDCIRQWWEKTEQGTCPTHRLYY